MKPRRLLLAVLHESLPWLVALLAADAVFILFIWLIDTEAFFVLIGLMLLISLVIAAAPLVYRFMRYRRVWPHLEAFSREPDEDHEAALTDLLPSFQRHLVHALGERLRATRTELNDANVAITEYETWIEGWVHGIKTPLALTRLLLDNRADEMSPLVAQRLSHAHTAMARDVEKILFYARLGARHRDYLFEPLDLHDLCVAAVQASRASLDEAEVTVEIEASLGCVPPVISDRGGLTFILGQLLSNSIKHAQVVRIGAEMSETEQPVNGGGQAAGQGDGVGCPTNSSGTPSPVPLSCNVALIFSDNGPGVSAADLPFIFDKGFTGASAAQGASATSHHSGAAGTNTGMGLYLAQRMANDLVIEMTATSGQATFGQTGPWQTDFERVPSGQATFEQTSGLTVTLCFPTTG